MSIQSKIAQTHVEIECHNDDIRAHEKGIASHGAARRLPRRSANRLGQRTPSGDVGRYQDSVVPADYSDFDVIRKGDDYYAITSTWATDGHTVKL